MDTETFTREEIIKEIYSHTGSKSYINETDSYEDNYTRNELREWSNEELADEMILLCTWENEVNVIVKD